MTAADPFSPGDSGSPAMPANETDARRFDTAMLAHDIRSALQGVVGGVAVMEHLTSDPTLREQIDTISAAALSLSGSFAGVVGLVPLVAANSNSLGRSPGVKRREPF